MSVKMTINVVIDNIYSISKMNMSNNIFSTLTSLIYGMSVEMTMIVTR